MKITFLGTGTSTGNPEIGCKCEVCTSVNPKDRRLRASVLINIDDKQLMIDCGPDFREQILPFEFRKMDGILITHEHYDHVGGLDDLRPFCRFGAVDLYAEEDVIEKLQSRIPYCFTNSFQKGIPSFKTHVITPDKLFSIGEVIIQPIRVMHAKLPIVGYRIGRFAYLTDLKYINENEFYKLENLDILVIDALRHTEHISHETLEDALSNIKRISPKNAYLTHMSHEIGLHDKIQRTLPENVYLSYDGLEIEIKD